MNVCGGHNFNDETCVSFCITFEEEKKKTSSIYMLTYFSFTRACAFAVHPQQHTNARLQIILIYFIQIYIWSRVRLFVFTRKYI